MSAICAVETCDRPVRKREWCDAHYCRWKRHGDLRAEVPLRRPFACKVDGCDGPYGGLGYCEKHYQRIRRRGTLELAVPVILAGPEHPSWKGDRVTYDSAHGRVQSRNGLADQYLCINCGGGAQEWAYDHSDPAVQTCPTTGQLYSTNPDHYVPLCRSCHRRIDWAVRRGDLGCVLVVMAR